MYGLPKDILSEGQKNQGRGGAYKITKDQASMLSTNIPASMSDHSSIILLPH